MLNEEVAESSARLNVGEDFDYLVRLLPEGWQAKAKELGALRRCRKLESAEVLLRVLLIHLAEGCSLRETALRAARGGLASAAKRCSDHGPAKAFWELVSVDESGLSVGTDLKLVQFYRFERGLFGSDRRACSSSSGSGGDFSYSIFDTKYLLRLWFLF